MIEISVHGYIKKVAVDENTSLVGIAKEVDRLIKESGLSSKKEKRRLIRSVQNELIEKYF